MDYSLLFEQFKDALAISNNKYYAYIKEYKKNNYEYNDSVNIKQKEYSNALGVLSDINEKTKCFVDQENITLLELFETRGSILASKMWCDTHNIPFIPGECPFLNRK